MKSEMDETIPQGEEAAAHMGVPLLDPEIVKVLGKPHFRQSFFTQNLL